MVNTAPYSTPRRLREQVFQRDGGNCTNFIFLENWRGIVPTRCGKAPVEIHHRITRGRGGIILDEVGETYHLMSLCSGCHKKAHDFDHAFATGLLLEGSVVKSGDKVVYTGPDPYLTATYAPRVLISEGDEPCA